MAKVLCPLEAAHRTGSSDLANFCWQVLAEENGNTKSWLQIVANSGKRESKRVARRIKGKGEEEREPFETDDYVCGKEYRF